MSNWWGHLSRHDFKAMPHQRDSDEQPVADAISGFARDQGAQLIAVGAYAHSRFREAAPGGVTRDTVDAPRIATLLVH